jgi:hypothetical protein
MTMVKKEVLFAATIILIGTIDWATTIVGVLFFGATETNPLLACLTKTNMVLFSAIKLSAITLTGLAFYKAEAKAKITKQISPFARNFLRSGYAISIFALTLVVVNNFSAIVRVA